MEVSTFVKHPDTNEMLPAEASGRMRPGDQLVDINGHGVEGLNAEEATSLIRQVKEGVVGVVHGMNRGPLPIDRRWLFFFFSCNSYSLHGVLPR